MATWNQLMAQFNVQSEADRGPWLLSQLTSALRAVSTERQNRNVLLYGAAFLQKPQVPGFAISITQEDLNGLMGALHGMDWARGLTLILHTPGGVTNATESIVAYIRSKFDMIEVVVPTFAMSAGTMISLACDTVWLARHSQLGPIDPQMVGNGGQISARAVVDQFERAKAEIAQDLVNAHAWAPILATLGPSLLVEAENALAYSERMVAAWLSTWMLKDTDNPTARGNEVAQFFNDAGFHKSHGRRIGREEARRQGVIVEDLEGPDRQGLQEAVLTAYHLMTLVFEVTPAVKLIMTSAGSNWIKNLVMAPEQS